MAFTNHETKEINCKILYCGPRSAGKNSNLRSILMHTSKDIRSGMFTLEEPAPFYFSFLPLSMGQIRDYHLKLHLYTMPAMCRGNLVLPTLAKGVDGIVYVVDSRAEKIISNIEELSGIRELLRGAGVSESEIPCVYQYNKRDLASAAPVAVLRKVLARSGAEDCEAVASEGIGTMATLESITKQVMRNFCVNNGQSLAEKA